VILDKRQWNDGLALLDTMALDKTPWTVILKLWIRRSRVQIPLLALIQKGIGWGKSRPF
jgi:hypothetical protein